MQIKSLREVPSVMIHMLISICFLSQVVHVSLLDVKSPTFLDDLRQNVLSGERSKPDIGDKDCDHRNTLSTIGENIGRSDLFMKSSIHGDTSCVNENKSHVGLNGDTSCDKVNKSLVGLISDTSSVKENKDHISLHGDTSKSCDTNTSSIIEENDTPNGPQDKQTVLFYVDLLGECTHCTAETELYLQTHLVSQVYRILCVSKFIHYSCELRYHIYKISQILKPG